MRPQTLKPHFFPVRPQAMLELAADFPTIMAPLITERDQYMVAVLRDLAQEAPEVKPLNPASPQSPNNPTIITQSPTRRGAGRQCRRASIKEAPLVSS